MADRAPFRKAPNPVGTTIGSVTVDAQAIGDAAGIATANALEAKFTTANPLPTASPPVVSAPVVLDPSITDVSAAGPYVWPAGPFVAVSVEVRSGTATIDGVPVDPDDGVAFDTSAREGATVTPPAVVVGAGSVVRVTTQKVA